MKREVRLYNLILPIWALWLVPHAWLVILPGNLLFDGLVFFLALTVLKRTDRSPLLRSFLWKLWLAGFAADFAGVLWLLLGALAADGFSPLQTVSSYVMYNPFGHPLALVWTLIAVAVSGVCVYGLNRFLLMSAWDLTEQQRHTVALSMAVFTAPWTFLLPSSWLYF